MKKIITIIPRQKGKTTESVRLFNINPEDSLLIVYSNKIQDYISNVFNTRHTHIISQNTVDRQNSLFSNVKTIIIDDSWYFDIKNMEEIYNLISQYKNNIENVFIFTSLNDETEFNPIGDIKLIQDIRTIGVKTFTSLMKKQHSQYTINYLDVYLERLKYNFLLDYDSSINALVTI